MSNSYQTAITQFENLINEAREQPHPKPATLLKAAGLPKTSGYRYIAAMEAEGFISRDESGNYQLGPSSQRAGLTAWKIGNLSPIIRPILHQLKQWHQSTSFLGILENHILHIGPHSVGRNSLETGVETRYLLAQPLPKIAQSGEVAISPCNGDFSKVIKAKVVPLMLHKSTTILIGVFHSGIGASSDKLGLQLEQLAGKIIESLESIS